VEAYREADAKVDPGTHRLNGHVADPCIGMHRQIVVAPTDEEAMAIANDTIYGLGSGIWTRDIHQGKTFMNGIQAGRVWVNCYHLYPAHAAFGGYKKSGVGRETHKMMLDHYQQTKNLLVSYDINPLGFF
jgi:aldehyde dehydrogenase